MIHWPTPTLRMLRKSKERYWRMYYRWSTNRHRHNTELILWVPCCPHLWSYDGITYTWGCSVSYKWISLDIIVIGYIFNLWIFFPRAISISNLNCTPKSTWQMSHGMGRRWWCPYQPRSSTTGSNKRFSYSKGAWGPAWLVNTPRKTVVDVWLVVWNMNFIFHNIWDSPSHWRTHIFQMVIAPSTR